ncbi:MAG: hypothetical protein WBA74_23555 [Cyclobacteriaceae bacterium]
MEQLNEEKIYSEQQQLKECAEKMLENIELQIQVTYDYQQLKALYQHREVILRMIQNNQT